MKMGMYVCVCTGMQRHARYYCPRDQIKGTIFIMCTRITPAFEGGTKPSILICQSVTPAKDILQLANRTGHVIQFQLRPSEEPCVI